ncbi:unnamed protein product [Brassica oleracea var. botrytis]|uniref:(rape) hypothetical protein n=1 Tax=Brassica napus TaxID=3708 RepID=A0A816JVP1_BRANA|nr:unnamed protein product [Brassica napus]
MEPKARKRLIRRMMKNLVFHFEHVTIMSLLAFISIRLSFPFPCQHMNQQYDILVYCNLN